MTLTQSENAPTFFPTRKKMTAANGYRVTQKICKNCLVKKKSWEIKCDHQKVFIYFRFQDTIVFLKSAGLAPPSPTPQLVFFLDFGKIFTDHQKLVQTFNGEVMVD